MKRVIAADVCVGDVVELTTGDIVPVDGVLLQSSALRVNESHITGESVEIAKKEKHDITLMSGSKVVQGNGFMLALAVGEYESFPPSSLYSTSESPFHRMLGGRAYNRRSNSQKSLRHKW
jgi:Ca2+-transporting ATPase